MAMDHSPAAVAVLANPPSQPSPPTTIIQGGDRRWRRLTEQANKAYAQGDTSLALATYTDALTEAERLFDAATGDHETVPFAVIFNVSCHNLAELFERSGETRKAESCYRMAYDRLLSVARSPCSPLAARVECVQHLKHALSVLVRHLHQHGDADEKIGPLIREAHHAAYSVYQVARHTEKAEGECGHCSIIPS